MKNELRTTSSDGGIAKGNLAGSSHYQEPTLIPLFKDLMRTPKMKEILKQPYPGVTELRCYAGQPRKNEV